MLVGPVQGDLVGAGHSAGRAEDGQGGHGNVPAGAWVCGEDRFAKFSPTLGSGVVQRCNSASLPAAVVGSGSNVVWAEDGEGCPHAGDQPSAILGSDDGDCAKEALGGVGSVPGALDGVRHLSWKAGRSKLLLSVPESEESEVG
jgi:hypothetical protein